MLNLVSLLLGGLALLGVAVAFLPLLGWLNWLVLPAAVVGLGLGAASGERGGRNLNLVVLIVGALRLMIGGGIL